MIQSQPAQPGYTPAGWLLVIALLVLSLATVLAGSARFRTMPVDDLNLLGAEVFAAHRWSIAGEPQGVQFDPDGITLTLKEPGMLRVRLTEAIDLQRFAAQGMQFLHITTQMSSASQKHFVADPTRRPIFYAKSWSGDSVDLYGAVARLNGLESGAAISRLLAVSPLADRLDVTFQIRTPGVWRISDLKVLPVAEVAHYDRIKQVLMGISAVLALACFVALVRVLSVTQWLLLSAVIVPALLLAGISNRAMKMAIERVQGVLHQHMPELMLVSNFGLQKLGHLLAFMAITAFLMLLRTRLRLSGLQVVCILLALALFTEAIQQLQPGRSPSVFDLVVDASGIVAGIVIAWLFRRVTMASSRLLGQRA